MMNFPFYTIIKSLDMAPAIMSIDEILKRDHTNEN